MITTNLNETRQRIHWSRFEYKHDSVQSCMHNFILKFPCTRKASNFRHGPLQQEFQSGAAVRELKSGPPAANSLWLQVTYWNRWCAILRCTGPGRWHSNSARLVARYHCPGPGAEGPSPRLGQGLLLWSAGRARQAPSRSRSLSPPLFSFLPSSLLALN